MTTLEVIQLVLLIVAALAFIGYVVYQVIKNKWLGQLIDTVKEAVKKAEETYPIGHGEEKLKMVLEAVKAKCEELGLPYGIIVKLITKIINTIIEHYNVIVK